jgi:alpha-1,2-mannosyltransferase
VGAALLCAFSVLTAVRGLRTPPLDLSVYRAGAQVVLHGIPLYRHSVYSGLDFTYPPLAALVFVPFAVLPFRAAATVMCAVNLAVLGYVCRRSLVALGVPSGPGRGAGVLLATGLTFWLDPVRTSVYLGQVNLVLLALVLWDLPRTPEHRTQGVGVGIAAGLKLTPLVFIPFLLLTRRFRAAATATAVFAGTVAIGVAVLPRDAADYWLGGLFAHPTRVFADPSSPHNQSLPGLLARIQHVPSVSLGWLVLVGVLLACALLVAVAADRRGERLLAITVVGLSGAAVSPYSWNHHWVWVVPLAVFLGHRVAVTPGRAERTGWLVATMALVALAPWIVDIGDPPVGHPTMAGAQALLLENLYVLLWCALLAATGWHVRPTARAVPGDADGQAC